MAKNHWHTAGSKTRSEAYKYGYKSGLGHTVSKQIESTEYDLKYETEIIQYIVPVAIYEIQATPYNQFFKLS